MKNSRKVIILVPPLLVGLTVLLFLFTYQHQKNIAGTAHDDGSTASSSDIVIVTEPLPEPITSKPEPDSDEPDAVACTMEAKMCPDGSFVGRKGPDCEFEACPSPIGETQYCSDESRLAEFCIEMYAPVCADVQVECITTPCEPVKETFSNSCFACGNDRVLSYTEGACEVIE